MLNFNIKTWTVVIFFCCLNSVAIANPITDENLNLGTKDWVLSKDGSGHQATDKVGQIKGYLSAASVNKGGSIDFKVSVNRPQNFTIEIYRVGYYQGNGARYMLTIGPIAGTTQPSCPRNETTGLVECNWAKSYTLNVPSNWTSGIYLARLENADGFDSGAIFVVRDDNRVADFLYQQPVNTYQAYNEYPEGVNGKSLYSNILGEDGAVKVSFNRPYAGYSSSYNGYSNFLQEEMNLVKWLEKEGFDVAYSTDVDTHANGSKLLNYHALIVGGHSEYWSKEMRDAFQNARSNSINLAFFGANDAYWQVRFEPASDGSPNRTLVCYKSSSLDPITNPALKTDKFRSSTVNRPEQELMGIQYTSWSSFWTASTFTDLIVKNSSHWAYQGSGFIEGQKVPKIVGYEIDTVDSSAPLPENTEYTVLAASPFVSVDGNKTQNSVIYKTPQGGWVFSTGTMAWSWALDFDSSLTSIGGPFAINHTNAGLQTVTYNILDRFSLGAGNNHPPVGQPVITGTAQEDQTLSVNTSSIIDSDGLGVFKYQWLRNGTNISGATSSSYTLVYADVTNSITVKVTYTDGLGKVETLTSAATSPVIKINHAPTGSVNITGTASLGQTLTATNNLADADGLGSINYQWQRNGTNINGATSSSYLVTSSDVVGSQIKVVASYTDGHGTVESVSSAAISVVTNTNTNNPPIGSVSITGTASPSQTLTAINNLADADGLGAIKYQWQRNSVNITGATSSSYLVTTSDVGSQIKVVASYTDGRGNLESVASASVTISNTAPSFLGIKLMETDGSNLCAYSPSLTDNIQITQYSCRGVTSKSKWIIEQVTSSSFRLTNQASAKVMAVNGSSTQNNATIVQQSLSVGAANQLWNIKSSKYGGYSIINQNSGLCITIPSKLSGSGLIQATCNINDTKQIWYLY